MVVNCFRSPTNKHLRHGKLKTEIQGSNQGLTAPLNPSNVTVSNVREGYSTYEQGLAGNTLRMGTLFTLILRTLTEADGSSMSKQRFEFELTLYNLHSAAP